MMYFLKTIPDRGLSDPLTLGEGIFFILFCVVLSYILLKYLDRLNLSKTKSQDLFEDIPVYKNKDLLLQDKTFVPGKNFPVADKIGVLGKIVIIILIIILFFIPFTKILRDYYILNL